MPPFAQYKHPLQPPVHIFFLRSSRNRLNLLSYESKRLINESNMTGWLTRNLNGSLLYGQSLLYTIPVQSSCIRVNLLSYDSNTTECLRKNWTGNWTVSELILNQLKLVAACIPVQTLFLPSCRIALVSQLISCCTIADRLYYNWIAEKSRRIAQYSTKKILQFSHI